MREILYQCASNRICVNTPPKKKQFILPGCRLGKIAYGKGRDRILRRFLHLPDAGRFPTDGNVEPQE